MEYPQDDQLPENVDETADNHANAKGTRELTKKQAKFIEAYTQGITKGNASASARQAGYSPKASNSAGARLLKELRPQIMVAQGRAGDLQKEVWHKDRESTIAKMVTDLETLEGKHANKPKYWDMLCKLRGYYQESNAGTPLISVAIKGSLFTFAQELAKQVTGEGKEAPKEVIETQGTVDTNNSKATDHHQNDDHRQNDTTPAQSLPKDEK